MKKELSDILNEAYNNYASIWAGVILAAIPISVLGSNIGKMVDDYISAPGRIKEYKKQFSEEISQQELYRLYNGLLPASRCTLGKTKKTAGELVNPVESVLFGYIAEEIKGLGLPKRMPVNEKIEHSKTFQETFLKHHYNNLPQPEDSISYVRDGLSARGF